MITVLDALGALATLIAALASIYIAYRQMEKRGKDRQLSKIVYIKMYHLRSRGEGRTPAYKKYIHRLKREIDVYDEFHFYRLNIFRKPQANFRIRDRSSGIVDMQILHPNQKVQFSDKGAEVVENYMEQTIRESSTIFLTNTMYYNGFQIGNEDFGMKMEMDTQEARMVVDFSSIPNYDSIILELPSGIFRRGDREEEISISKPAPGTFQIEKKDMKKDDVLRMDFKIDWEIVG